MGLNKMTRERESGTKEEKGPITECWRSNIKSLNGKGDPIKDSEKDYPLTVGGKPTKGGKLCLGTSCKPLYLPSNSGMQILYLLEDPMEWGRDRDRSPEIYLSL